MLTMAKKTIVVPHTNISVTFVEKQNEKQDIALPRVIYRDSLYRGPLR